MPRGQLRQEIAAWAEKKPEAQNKQEESEKAPAVLRYFPEGQLEHEEEYIPVE